MSLADDFLRWLHDLPPEELDQKLGYKGEGERLPPTPMGRVTFEFYRSGEKGSLEIYDNSTKVICTLEQDAWYLERLGDEGRQAIASTKKMLDAAYPKAVDGLLRAAMDALK